MEQQPNIKDLLPHGAIGTIAKQCNVHRTTVTRVIDGETTDLNVWKAIQKILQSERRKKEKIKQIQQELIN